MNVPIAPISTTVSLPSLVNLPTEILLSILRYVLTGAKIRVIGPRQRAPIITDNLDILWQDVKKKLKFWSSLRSPKPEPIVPLQPALSILHTSKRLGAIGRPLLCELVTFDFTKWHAHEVSNVANGLYNGIPFDKFQHIQLSLRNLPSGGLEPYKALRCLHIESETEDLCSGVRFELGLLDRMERYQRRTGRFEIDVLLLDYFGRRLRFVIDRRGKFDIFEIHVDLSDYFSQAEKK